jgi:hypothetical protein
MRLRPPEFLREGKFEWSSGHHPHVGCQCGAGIFRRSDSFISRCRKSATCASNPIAKFRVTYEDYRSVGRDSRIFDFSRLT